MIEKFLHGIHQIDGGVFGCDNFSFEMIDSVYFFVELIEVLAGGDSTAGHEGEIRLVAIFDWEERKMILIVFLDGMRNGRRCDVEWGELLQVTNDLVEFSVRGGFDDVLLDFLLLL
jgi:hypothetical protein